MDHATLAEQYGASDEAIEVIRAFAAAHGLTVTSIDRLRRVVGLSGSVSNMEQAFGTVLHNYSIGGPAIVVGVDPCCFRPKLSHTLRPCWGWTTGRSREPGLDRATCRHPTILRNFDALSIPAWRWYRTDSRSHRTGREPRSQDLQTYFAASGLAKLLSFGPLASARASRPYGQDPVSDGEVMLDIEIVGAMASGATIVVYFAENSDQGFYQAVSQAVHDLATTAVSISWGSPEKDWSQQTMDAWNSLGQGACP